MWILSYCLGFLICFLFLYELYIYNTLMGNFNYLSDFLRNKIVKEALFLSLFWMLILPFIFIYLIINQILIWSKK